MAPLACARPLHGFKRSAVVKMDRRTQQSGWRVQAPLQKYAALLAEKAQQRQGLLAAEQVDPLSAEAALPAARPRKASLLRRGRKGRALAPEAPVAPAVRPPAIHRMETLLATWPFSPDRLQVLTMGSLRQARECSDDEAGADRDGLPYELSDDDSD